MLSEVDLLQIARERINDGRLPGDIPERVWGSPNGDGQACALCDRAIRPDQPLIELDERILFHVACHALWQRACYERDGCLPGEQHSERRV
jgi:hypothetical protein